MNRKHRLALSGIMALALAWSAGSQDARAQGAVYLSEQATYCEIFRSLSRMLPGECAMQGIQVANAVAPRRALTRSIVLKDAEGGKTRSRRPEPQEMALNLKVQFEFDSDRLTTGAMQVLDRLAAVVKSDLMDDIRIQIVGHADGIGDALYNLALSERRAGAVRRYLVEQRGVAASRLRSLGRGESEPYDVEKPDDPINRRVEFVNLSG